MGLRTSAADPVSGRLPLIAAVGSLAIVGFDGRGGGRHFAGASRRD